MVVGTIAQQKIVELSVALIELKRL
jgi:hypothetical protein